MGKIFQATVLGAVGLTITGLSISAFAAEYIINDHLLASQPDHKSTIIEIAGADDSGRATKKQLRDAGTGMVPDENLKKSSANPIPVTDMKMPEAKPVPQPVEPKTVQPVPESTPNSGIDKPAKMAETAAGPYLRVDVGYGFAMDSDGTQSAGGLTNSSVDNAALIGGGIGYRVTESFRSDITFSYRPDADVSATTAAGNTLATEVNGLSVMANGYWDIATFDTFTPYVGAGAGYARLSTSTQTTTGGIANESGATSDNFSWALMLGGTFDINSVAAIDIGYRYVNLGEFKQATSTTFDDLMVHETRAGLRYKF